MVPSHFRSCSSPRPALPTPPGPDLTPQRPSRPRGFTILSVSPHQLTVSGQISSLTISQWLMRGGKGVGVVFLSIVCLFGDRVNVFAIEGLLCLFHKAEFTWQHDSNSSTQWASSSDILRVQTSDNLLRKLHHFIALIIISSNQPISMKKTPPLLKKDQ